MAELSKSYDPKLVEEKWYSFWEEEGLFTADPHSKKEPYCIVIPPPNVTGVLHMGHALVDTLQDILIRWKRMLGFEVLWVPGTDHAGIATQTVVERHLLAQTGKRRKDFSREEFLEHIWQWKEKSQSQIISQIKKLGCSCDWTRLRFTMDDGCNAAVNQAFQKMFDAGLIYRGDYLVNWDPITQTALSDDEVEHEERSSFLWHIRYPFANGKGHITIATTRPETLLGDTAVAVHPDDARYNHRLGEQVILPLTGRTISLIADPFVDRSFGSGAVKITPAHDFNDFETGNRHKLERINILTPDARINEAGGKFANLSVEEARDAVVQALKEEGFLEKIEPHILRVGLSYRSKAVLQPYLSKQWFVKMSHFKDKLISAVKEKRVTLIPPHWESTYFHWIENLRDWCISRQIWWGHRIPIWYNRHNPDEMVCSDGQSVPELIKKNPQDWVQDPDVLDTWFSSALWPFSVLGWPENSADLKKFYPTSTLITGHDILFFWVARMILMGEYLLKDVPFKETFLHGLIYGKSYWRVGKEGSVRYLTAEEKKPYDLGAPTPPDVHSKWEKMSKTKGNVIDPLAIIDEYGTDAMRIALAASATYARQIDLDLRRFEEFKNFANKIWNGARFVFMNIEDLQAEELAKGLNHNLFGLEDRWILSVLNRTIIEINTHFTDYAFDRAAMRSYEFFWNDFCAVYVEAAKPILFGKIGTPQQRINKQKILVVVLLSAIRLLHPITPFITEELFSLLRQSFGNMENQGTDFYTKEASEALQSPACIKAPFPKPHKSDISSTAEEEFAKVFEIIRSIRNIRMEMGLPPSEKTELFIIGLKDSFIQEHGNIILALTPTTQMIFSENEPSSFGSTAIAASTKLFIPIPKSLMEKERVRLEKEKEKLEKLVESTKSKLSNEEFRSKAPSHVVEKLEAALAESEASLNETKAKLYHWREIHS